MWISLIYGIVLTVSVVICKPLNDNQQCSPEITDVQPDSAYSIDQFVGQWFVLARTQGPWAGHNWASSVTSFRQDGQDLRGLYSLYVSRRGKGMCIPGMPARLRQTDVNGQYSATLEAPAPIQGNYTVYRLQDEFAITYECYSRAAAPYGCSKHGRVVAILGRRPVQVPADISLEATRLVCQGETIGLVNHTRSCVQNVQWPNQGTDIADAVRALDRTDVLRLKREVRAGGVLRRSRDRSAAGCKICENDLFSVDEPGCLPIFCPSPCLTGYDLDARGCETCECYSGPVRCKQQTCDQPCEHGYERDAHGCLTCTCSRCAELECEKECTYGHVRDERGCKSCACRTEKVNATVSCDLTSLELNEECSNFCPNGRKVDARGCETCDCKCPEKVCKLFCQKYRMNDSGCRMCECVESHGKDENESAVGTVEEVDDINGDDSEVSEVSGSKEELLFQSLEANKVPDIDEEVADSSEDDSEEGSGSGEKLLFQGSEANKCPDIDCEAKCHYHAVAYDENGCLTCECTTKCPTLDCGDTIRCDFGLVKDESGCDTCACVAGEDIRGYEGGEQKLSRTVIGVLPRHPQNFAGEMGLIKITDESTSGAESLITTKLLGEIALTCPAITCMNGCPAKRVVNEEGCLTCSCPVDSEDDVEEELFECSPLTCVNECENRKFDKNGCLTCECEDIVDEVDDDDYVASKEGSEEVNSTSCVEPKCWDGPCRHGSAQDANGCETCDCLRPKKPEMACPFLHCPKGPCREGWWPDSNGCASCKCRQHELECKPLECEIECPHGFVLDEEGCQTCECLIQEIPICPDLDCDVDCEEYREDDSGCQVCDCACPALACPNKCENGNVINSKGCPSCECQSNVVFDIPESESLVFADEPAEPLTANDEEPKRIAEDFALEPIMSGRECLDLSRTCWDGPCLYGSVPNLEDCPTCICVSSPDYTCPKLECAQSCIWGSHFDRYGCETCNCKPDPSLNCRDMSTCPLRCANGLRETERGCKICECFVLLRPEIPCQRITCDKSCSSYKTDEKGCRTCECGCTKPLCWNGACRYGSEPDENGCETCACKRPEMPEISCGLLDCRGRECPNGYRIGRDGCYTCQCIDGKEMIVDDPNPKQKENCNEDITLCPFACMYGHETRSDGCYTCECKMAYLPDADPCPLLDCNYCEFGYEQDGDGCSTCKCKPYELAELTCNQDCSKVCHYNYVATKDENGCLQCRCLEQPEARKEIQKDMKEDISESVEGKDEMRDDDVP